MFKPIQRYVSCLVKSKDNQFVLQLRDEDCQTYPGYIATFGGGIEEGETPMQALIRELKEELGAKVLAEDVVELGVLEELEEGFHGVNYVYYWHDRFGTITGCYEGKAKYYNDPVFAEQDVKIMKDVYFALGECIKK